MDALAGMAHLTDLQLGSPDNELGLVSGARAPMLTDACLVTLVAAWPHLTRLELRFRSPLSPVAVLGVGLVCRQLERLRLDSPVLNLDAHDAAVALVRDCGLAWAQEPVFPCLQTLAVRLVLSPFLERYVILHFGGGCYVLSPSPLSEIPQNLIFYFLFGKLCLKRHACFVPLPKCESFSYTLIRSTDKLLKSQKARGANTLFSSFTSLVFVFVSTGHNADLVFFVAL
jgi:hypothetical protein